MQNYSIPLEFGPYNIKKGHNRIMLQNTVWIEKTRMIGLFTQNSNPILIDNYTQSYLSDYFINSTMATKIDLKFNLRFCFRVLIDQWFYFTRVSYLEDLRPLASEDQFELTASFIDKDISATKVIDIQKCNFF